MNAIASSFAPIFASLEQSRLEMPENQFDFLVGSALLGIANRAAFGSANVERELTRIQNTVKALIDAQGIDNAGVDLRKLDDDANFWEPQQAHYEALYSACATAWADLKGKPMPSQRPSTRVAQSDDRNAHSIAARFGIKTDAVSDPAKAKAKVAARKRSSK